MRESWTDERMDDLSRNMDSGFARVDASFARIDADLREVRTQMGAMQRTMAMGFIALAAAIIAGFGGTAGLIATQI